MGMPLLWGLASGLACFVGLGLFFRPGEWACEPYFSNPINYKIIRIENKKNIEGKSMHEAIDLEMNTDNI